MQKGTNYSILDLNSQRLGRLKVNVINQKNLVLKGKTLQKKLHYYGTIYRKIHRLLGVKSVTDDLCGGVTNQSL